MRFMIIVKASADSEAGRPPEPGRRAAMAAYHEELARAGALLDAAVLQPSAAGWRIHYDGGAPTVVDGPFADPRTLVAGYAIIQARSREEALEWTRRCPPPRGDCADGVIEVRALAAGGEAC